ncbi:30S ribosome-binding factor RbfA [Alkalilimnicola sp. S0819]|uniref:30S ribosome-binding factor RbfA n=1 Tax=Alkalilimnicola sp. S0819 TaxID=2613922 RepID=UPI00126246DC|nr:30S ribosome-binding factor RbfA [Alkalilimnicola sp. S0819]KAB7628442.1 30S ribosome-binding factor RbfA [Alkalilimnicola sp. S0819]MPQ15346.1 30S ribosome-binding factor RbfA [Alkalilimnicola sp. S0819]
MPRDYPRTRRVADQIQRELAGLIRDQVRDPRVGSITVSEVEVARDFAHAKVYVTQLGADAERSREAVEGLNRAAGFLRRELGRGLRLRNVPALKFFYDPAFERGAHLSALIDHAVTDTPPADDSEQD